MVGRIGGVGVTVRSLHEGPDDGGPDPGPLGLLAEAFVDVWSRPDPMARAVRGVQLFGKSYTHLFAGTRGPDDVDAVVRSFERAIARLR